MRYARIYHALHFQPWLVTPAFHGSMVDVLDKHISGNAADYEEFRTRHIAAETSPPDRLPGSSRFAETTVDSRGIATVNISGIIAAGATALEKSCYGGVSPEDIQASVQAALDAPEVRGIILNINSPGGTVAGVPEAANHIAEIQRSGAKRIVAYTGEMMASAAYWIASGASAIYSTALADVGSIGVYVPFVDSSARARQMGYDVKLIKDGKFKGQGYPGTSLSEESVALMQDHVNKIGAAFRSHVSTYRTRLNQDAMQGQTFLGRDAASVGLVDGIVGGLNEVKARLI